MWAASGAGSAGNDGKNAKNGEKKSLDSNSASNDNLRSLIYLNRGIHIQLCDQLEDHARILNEPGDKESTALPLPSSTSSSYDESSESEGSLSSSDNSQ